MAHLKYLEEPVFWELLHRSCALRSELAARLGVSAPTISRAVEALEKHGLVCETSAVIGRRGRKPGVLRVNPDLTRLLGVEIDRNQITVVVTDACGGLWGRGSARCHPPASVSGTVATVRRLAALALSDAGAAPDAIGHLGAGHTGALDLETGVCLSWEGAPEWAGVPLRQLLSAAFGVEVTLDDRARALALAERFYSPPDQRHGDAIYVTAGTGIGCGLFVGGRLLRGATQAAGELGHMMVDPNGPRCLCGATGCVEAIASSTAILRRVRQGSTAGDAITIEHVVAAARRGEPLASRALQQAGEALGIAIANAIHLLNPSLVVLCGKLATAARELLLEPVCAVIRRQCFQMLSRGLEVRLAPFRKDVVAVGCALLAAQDYAAFELHRRLDSREEEKVKTQK